MMYKTRLLNKKIKAFTLAEIIVALILTVLVCSAAYYAYSYLWRYTTIQKTTELAEYTKFENIFSADIKRAESVIAKSSETIITQNYNLTEVEYKIDLHHLIRKTEVRSDTFFFRTESFFFETFYEHPDLIHTINIRACNEKIIREWNKKYPENFYWKNK
ncbi:MAG: hypothetical protein JXA53_09310 [Bacteroidales bacterium]|nr:hypothetical protein [Bacteroidales bacterium]